MITFPHIGFIGRLGNQMFQYAALMGLAYKHDLDFCLTNNNIELYDCFNITTKINSFYNNNFISPHGLTNIAHGGHTVFTKTSEEINKFFTTKFDQDFFNSNHNGKSVLGYFQNYNYFLNIESELRKQFSFKKKYDKISESYITENYDESILALHIRRTDYLSGNILNNLKLEYYENALSYFDQSIPVLVFSDDSVWCEKQYLFNSDRFTIIKTNNTYIDLCLMSKCDYHIIANSTFSWWGSWLARSKKTICPKQWFSPNYNFLDSDGLRLPHWISI